MPSYTVPLDDIRFVLNEVLNYQQLNTIPACADATPDLISQILEEAAKICQDVLFPLNQPGDHEGCRLENGEVITPKGFKEAYQAFREGGWTALSCDPNYGGMGMPLVINTVLQEMICSANMSFGMYPGLSAGAYESLALFGTDEQKALYLPKIVDGTWSGTMNLTEPHCGTDLGLIRTKAEEHPDGDGSWAITGQKIYISAGEHDMVENIVHLVLARLPDAPKGVKGISLFIVPKFIPDEAGNPADRNDLQCVSIEHKMGIKASATCVMSYEGAKGWLVGEPHAGLKAMFAMMNNARLGVAMQGLGIGEVSYQNAAFFAKDRLQMRALDGAKYPEKEADPIIVHPDVRKMLLTMKAFNEGARALAYWAGINLDIAHAAENAEEKQAADDLVALLTPILKAYLTDMGTDCANLAIQVHGGHGYIWEYGVEQYARDARIAQIYEGTNGIQALDLVGRKMGQHMGRLLRRFFHPASEMIEAESENVKLAEFLMPFAKSFMKLQQSTALIAQKGLKDPNEAGAASTDYLRQFALVALGFMWVKMAKVCLEKLELGEGNKEFYGAKLHTARFFFARMLPEADLKFKTIMAGAESLMAMPEDMF